MKNKIAVDQSDELDVLTTKICGLVRNMIYSAYAENDYNKARRNGLELFNIVRDELNSYPIKP